MNLCQRASRRLTTRFGAEVLSQTDYPRLGYHLRLDIGPGHLRELAAMLAEDGFYLEYITAVDRGENLELAYVYGLHHESCRLLALAAVPKGQGALSIASVLPAADWQEREVFDLLGQRFISHPNLKRILLPEEADFHPLLKDFRAGPELSGEEIDLERP